MRWPWVAGFLLSCACFLAACSSPPVHVAVPSGWKPVTYRGLTIDVPATWPIYQRSKEICGISGPGVLVGPPTPTDVHIFCPLVVRFPGRNVWLRAYAPGKQSAGVLDVVDAAITGCGSTLLTGSTS